MALRDPNMLLEIAEKMHKPREYYLRWKQIAERYKRGEKSVYAKAFLASAGANLEERKMNAMTTPDYADYLKAWNRAERMRTKFEVAYENLENDLAAYQSAIAFDREMIKKGI